MIDLLLKNAKIFNSDNHFFGDIAISNGKIKTIGKALNIKAKRVIDAAGKIVIPGGVDIHTHLDMPFMGMVSADDFESGTLASAFGGTTTIVDFAIQQQDKSLIDALKIWQKKALSKAFIDYSFHLGITNASRHNLDQIGLLKRNGVTSVKIFLAYKNAMMLEDDEIYKVLLECKRSKILPMFHAENGHIIEERTEELLRQGKGFPKYHALSRPATVELEAIDRVISIAQLVDIPIYIVHVSTLNGAAKILDARVKGRTVLFETCPHYLLFTEKKYLDPDEGIKYVMSPPLRKEEDRRGLRNLLKQELIDVISTDHCPFYLRTQKKLGLSDFTKVPNGVGGIENRMIIMFNEIVNKLGGSIEYFVSCTATKPAKIFGLYPRKGTIQVGSDADIVVLDPGKSFTISCKRNHEKTDYTIYENYQSKISVAMVIIRGKVKIEDNCLMLAEKEGDFIKRKSSMVY